MRLSTAGASCAVSGAGRRAVVGLLPVNGTTLQKTPADCAEKLTGTRPEQPFGHGWEVFKVRGSLLVVAPLPRAASFPAGG